MFSKKVFVPGMLIEFYFHSIQANCKVRYHVTALLPSHQSIHFEMQYKQGGWKIMDAPQPPKWIRKLEDELSVAIIEYATQTSFEEIHSLPPHQNVLVQPEVKIGM